MKMRDFNLQEKVAIRRLEKAFAACSKLGLRFCGMDLDLLVAHKKAVAAMAEKEKKEGMGGRSGNYCHVAEAAQAFPKIDAVKKLDIDCYEDSGGW